MSETTTEIGESGSVRKPIGPKKMIFESKLRFDCPKWKSKTGVLSTGGESAWD
jgi:hypothetical protein